MAAGIQGLVVEECCAGVGASPDDIPRGLVKHDISPSPAAQTQISPEPRWKREKITANMATKDNELRKVRDSDDGSDEQ